ncbi:MAG: translation initiation factor IF-2 subunit beta [Candidatus Micrarchaeota archaeon]
MVSEDYDKLLEKAYSLLPEKATRRERFEVPVVESMIQGSKTIIKNFEGIALALRRKPYEISKYLARELAVPISVEGQRLVLQGKFYDRVLNEKIKNYTEMYVICKECKKPDTKITEMGRGMRMLVCEACGARSPVRAH